MRCQVELGHTLRIGIGKGVRSSVLDPYFTPSMLESFEVTFFAGLSEQLFYSGVGHVRLDVGEDLHHCGPPCAQGM